MSLLKRRWRIRCRFLWRSRCDDHCWHWLLGACCHVLLELLRLNRLDPNLKQKQSAVKTQRRQQVRTTTFKFLYFSKLGMQNHNFPKRKSWLSRFWLVIRATPRHWHESNRDALWPVWPVPAAEAAGTAAPWRNWPVCSLQSAWCRQAS